MRALLAELVDARDLKSRGAKAPSRFKSGGGHQYLRWREEQKRKEEQEKIDRLIAEAEAWRRAENVRAYITAVMQKMSQGHLETGAEELEKWREWALESADRIDPLMLADP